MSNKQAFREFKNVYKDISLMDKLLPVLIIVSMIFGVLLSVYAPRARNSFNGAEVVGVSIPLAVGLIIMMVPPFCKINWEDIWKQPPFKRYARAIWISLVINWIICPFLMFGLAWLTLFDEEEYRIGIIMIGMARCVAMVLVWNEIAHGDNELCALIVLINSLLQVVLYAPYQIFFCYVITGADYHLHSSVTYSSVAKSVGFFLGLPLAIGILIRVTLVKSLGLDFYKNTILKFISPWSLIALLYTIIVIFIEKGNDFIKNIGPAFRCFVPLIAYFMITWFGTFFLLRYFSQNANRKRDKETESAPLLCGCEEKILANPEKWKVGCSGDYSQTITQTFTAASNNFELSLVVAISIYGSGSKQAIAATFGPLLEVPILLILAYLARYFRFKFIWSDIE